MITNQIGYSRSLEKPSSCWALLPHFYFRMLKSKSLIFLINLEFCILTSKCGSSEGACLWRKLIYVLWVCSHLIFWVSILIRKVKYYLVTQVYKQMSLWTGRVYVLSGLKLHLIWPNVCGHLTMEHLFPNPWTLILN